MNTRAKNLAMVGGAVLVVGFVAVNTLMAPAAPVPAPDVTVDSFGTVPASGSPDPTELGVPGRAPGAPGPAEATPLGTAAANAGLPVEGASPVPDDARRSYAIGLHDLAGLPPDAAPGAQLELWVTWEPPVTKEPRLQRLISDVVLERTIPGPVPEAPVTVLLSVPENRVSDLIYADGYGRLSVVVPQ